MRSGKDKHPSQGLVVKPIEEQMMARYCCLGAQWSYIVSKDYINHYKEDSPNLHSKYSVSYSDWEMF